jgi:hypothetical protein
MRQVVYVMCTDTDVREIDEIRRFMRMSDVIVGLSLEEQLVVGKALRMYKAMWADPREKQILELLLKCEVWDEDEEEGE